MANETRNEGGNTNVMAGCGWQHVNWETIPIERPSEGIERQMVVGNNLMICRFRFAANLVTPEHSHPHEQMSIVVKGRVRFFVAGAERIASPADRWPRRPTSPRDPSSRAPGWAASGPSATSSTTS